MNLPIDLELLKKREEIPIKLAELSYRNSEQAVILLRKWGEKKSPVSVLHKEICDYINREGVKA
ncbi:hypothetical protein [Oceanobacillus salinisoli]|uniref:hypothetical protein n=1 Tax=Oceanobacillus salinisoli TaxID=2678611 RepID=UPI0012E155B9|nr:hypothetical protein [Oceanobacillus salinisoli]